MFVGFAAMNLLHSVMAAVLALLLLILISEIIVTQQMTHDFFSAAVDRSASVVPCVPTLTSAELEALITPLLFATVQSVNEAVASNVSGARPLLTEPLAPAGEALAYLPKRWCDDACWAEFSANGTLARCMRQGLQPKCVVTSVIAGNGNVYYLPSSDARNEKVRNDYGYCFVNDTLVNFPRDALIPWTVAQRWDRAPLDRMVLTDFRTEEVVDSYRSDASTPIADYFQRNRSADEGIAYVPPEEATRSQCRFIVGKPTVFLFHFYAHNLYHSFTNNLAPFQRTVSVDFAEFIMQSISASRSAYSPLSLSDVVVVYVNPPQVGGKEQQRMLDLLLRYFTSTPLIQLSDIPEYVCFSHAILGISTGHTEPPRVVRMVLPMIRLEQAWRAHYAQQAQGPAPLLMEVLAAFPQPQQRQLLRPLLYKFREAMLSEWSVLAPIPHMVYLSRNTRTNYRGRRVVNEKEMLNEVQHLLRDYVWRQCGRTRDCRFNDSVPISPLKPVFLEQVSLVDQICEMSRTNLLVAPHGAGMTNCVWMPPGSVTLEFVGPEGKQLPLTYDRLCNFVSPGDKRRESRHIWFIAETDPSQLTPEYAVQHPKWEEKKHQMHNIVVPHRLMKTKLQEALKLYEGSLKYSPRMCGVSPPK